MNSSVSPPDQPPASPSSPPPSTSGSDSSIPSSSSAVPPINPTTSVPRSLTLSEMIALNESNSLTANHRGLSPSSIPYSPAFEQKKSANIQRLLNQETLDLESLKKSAWSGVPAPLRPAVWKILLGNLPVNASRRLPVLIQRREEYGAYRKNYYEISDHQRTESELDILRQIRQDVPRTCGQSAFFRHPNIQQSLERILYVFAIRHPASSYVQGINDLLLPFFAVYLYEYRPIWDVQSSRAETFTGAQDGNSSELDLTTEELHQLEGDCYWSLSNLLDTIQDHYTFAQPGIQRLIYRLQELIGRLDLSLLKHLDDHNVQFLHFAFRWFNCLLMREFSLPLIIRLWTTLFCEGDGISSLLVYTCAALLMKFSSRLKEMEFQDLVVFLQKLPTENWSESDMEMVLSQAFLYKSWFHSSPHHLQ
jgi:hypothetical protein